MCEKNAEITDRMDRPDLAYTWRILGETIKGGYNCEMVCYNKNMFTLLFLSKNSLTH